MRHRTGESPTEAVTFKRNLFGLYTIIAFVTVIITLTSPFAGRSNALIKEAPAMLAVIGNDGNVLVYDANGKNPIRITTDAVPNQRVYQWPTWSTDGRLAYFGASSDPADTFSLRVFIAESINPDAPVKITTAYSSTDDVFTYAAWSPATCAVGEDCRQLALLYTPPDPNGFGLRLIRDQAAVFDDKVVGQSAPFFFDFAPDGKRMIWQQAGKQLSIYDLATTKAAQTLSDMPGKFQVPMWSPTDDRLLFGVQNGINPDLTDLVMTTSASNDATRQIIAGKLDSPLTFAWSPDGKYVAYVAAFDKVLVLDGQTGKTIATGANSDVVAHFWSPQSDRVAYLVVNRDTSGSQARLRTNGHTPVEQAVGGLSWHVLDVASGSDVTLVSFTPSRDMIYLLNFFDQFARSHRLWSPNGQYLGYGVMDVLGKTSVQLIDTRQPDRPPVKVGSGTIGIWSW